MKPWRLTRAARADLNEIWSYTVDRWGEAQAERYIRQIENDLAAAADGSRSGRAVDGYWRIRSGHHLCIYHKLPDGEIEIIRILHERMDIRQHL